MCRDGNWAGSVARGYEATIGGSGEVTPDEPAPHAAGSVQAKREDLELTGRSALPTRLHPTPHGWRWRLLRDLTNVERYWLTRHPTNLIPAFQKVHFVKHFT
jgi:hypothetical protein